MPSDYLSVDDFAAKVRFEQAEKRITAMSGIEATIAARLDDRRELKAPDAAKWLGISLAKLERAIERCGVPSFASTTGRFEKCRIPVMCLKEIEWALTARFGETEAQARERIFAYTSKRGPGTETKKGKGLNLGTKTKEESQRCDSLAKVS